MSAVVDVREREHEFTIPTPPPVVIEASDPRDHRAALRRRRQIVGGSLAAIVALVVVQQVVGILMADQRQRHLAHEFTIPDSDIKPGEASMVLQIPTIGLNDIVAEGASSSELRGGPGRVIGSAELADGGNVVVLGRKFRFGGGFDRLGELAEGDTVVAKSRGGVVRSYTVESVKKVAETSDAPLTAGDDRLTLVTSGPGLLPTKRLVVVAAADSPPPTPPTEASGEPARLGVDSLDERSTSPLGLVVALVLMGGSVAAIVVGVRRLRELYRLSTIISAMVPMVSLVVIVSFVIGDSLLATTL